MENYTVDYELDYDNNDARLIFKTNNVVIAEFLSNFTYFYNNFVVPYDSQVSVAIYTLFDINGYVGMHKQNNLLTFRTSKYSCNMYGDFQFTIVINDNFEMLMQKLKGNRP